MMDSYRIIDIIFDEIMVRLKHSEKNCYVALLRITKYS